MMTPGAGGHLRAEEAVGAGEGGQGHQQHLQALRSQETPENIQGDRAEMIDNVHHVNMEVGEIYLANDDPWFQLLYVEEEQLLSEFDRVKATLLANR